MYNCTGVHLNCSYIFHCEYTYKWIFQEPYSLYIIFWSNVIISGCCRFNITIQCKLNKFWSNIRPLFWVSILLFTEPLTYGKIDWRSRVSRFSLFTFASDLSSKSTLSIFISWDIFYVCLFITSFQFFRSPTSLVLCLVSHVDHLNWVSITLIFSIDSFVFFSFSAWKSIPIKHTLAVHVGLMSFYSYCVFENGQCFDKR